MGRDVAKLAGQIVTMFSFISGTDSKQGDPLSKIENEGKLFVGNF